MSVALRIEDLAVRLGTSEVLQGLSLSLNAGARTGLIGANGAGKTTLLDCIGGQLSPQAGRVIFNGTAITAWPPHRRARAGLARTFQRLGLVPSMSVVDNVQVALRTESVVHSRARAEAVLAECGYEGAAQTLIQDLPLLQQKRVALARSLAPKPQVLLLDELTAGLTREESQSLLRALDAAEETTVLWVEHDLQLLAEGTERTLLLDAGRIQADLASATLSEHPLVRQLYLAGGAE